MADTSNRKRSKRNPKTFLRLTAEEPSKEGSLWEILVTALASKGGNSLDDAEVQFYVDGACHSITRTDSNGRAQLIINAPIGKRRVSVEAQIVGQPWVQRTMVDLPISTPTKASSFESSIVGSNGNYRVVVVVYENNNSPVKDMKVQFLNAETGEIEYRRRTKDSGIATVSLTVPDDDVLELEVLVHGLHEPRHPELLHLQGRRMDEELPPIPEPRERPKIHLTQSFLDGWGESRGE